MEDAYQISYKGKAMSFYIVVFATFMFFSFVEIFTKLNMYIKRLIEYVILGITIVISSVRTGPVGDWDSYELVFQQTDINMNVLSAIFKANTHHTEPVYNLLNYLVKYFYNDFRVFVILEAVIVNVLIYLLCRHVIWRKNEQKKDYTITVFFTLWCLGLFHVIIVRQTIAVALCWSSIRYIKDKKPYGFIFITVLASFVHRASFIWIFAYWLYYIDTRKIKQRWKYILCLMAAVLPTSFAVRLIAPYVPGIAGSKLRLYMNRGLTSYGEIYSIVFLLGKSFANTAAVLFVILWLYRRFPKDRQFTGMSSLYCFGSAVVIASALLSNQLARMATPYTMLSIFIFPYVFDIKTSKSNRLIYFAVLTAYLFLRMYVSIHGYDVLKIGYPSIWS